MHSRIIQLSTEPYEGGEDYITEADFAENGFVGYIADYVDSDTNRGDDIAWLMSILEPYGAKYDGDAESITFPEDFKEKYFAESFEQLRNMVTDMTLEEFANDTDLCVFKLKQLIEDIFDMYIYFDDYGYPITLDEFVRDLEPNKPYYIGGTLDYHY